jgi:predicted ATPase/DNA-binding CsgD family transcriptional regulator
VPSLHLVTVLDRPDLGDVRIAAAPLPTSPLIGRETELVALRAILTQNRSRLLTLTGPGGAGKSRLAVELAYDIGSAYRNVWFVDLTTIREPAQVPGAIAHAVGVHDSGTRPLAERVREALSGEPGLMLLDNFEQVLDAAAFVDDLVAACPNLVAVVTSREALGVRSEHVYLIEPLAVPDAGQLAGRTSARDVPSVMLFEERARARRASFQLTDEALPAVAAICARLDGLPLAIELAAAQASVLTPAVILARLEAGAPRVVAVHRDLPARHQTLKATVAWSYNLLKPVEQMVFRRCAVFSGGFTAEAAAAVCRTAVTGPLTGEGDTLGVLAQLVAKSLVEAGVETSNEPRYRLLGTIRRYAIEQLDLADEVAEARGRHATYFVELSEKLQLSLRGPAMAATLDALARDYGNFRAVFEWAHETGDLTSGLRLANALYRYWVTRGHLGEARGWLETALSRSQTVPTAVRAAALGTGGVLAAMQHDHERATGFFRESLELWETLGETGRVASALLNLGIATYSTGRADEAHRHLERAQELFVAVGDRSGQAKTIASRARIAREQEDLARAVDLAEESLSMFQDVGDLVGTAQQLANVGHIRLALDDRLAAASAFRQALEAWRTLGDTVDVAECLEGVAAVVANAQPRRSAHLLGAAEALRETSGARVAAVDLARYAQLVARVKSHMREDTFVMAWREGRELPVDEAMDLALQENSPQAANAPGDDVLGQLSPRERDVAQLIASGRSNREIADALVVSVKTVETHIQHIFGKLNVKARAEIAVWASRHGLI